MSFLGNEAKSFLRFQGFEDVRLKYAIIAQIENASTLHWIKYLNRGEVCMDQAM